jgi:EKC/KEOPS complex subunit CGI121/TPRKB
MDPFQITVAANRAIHLNRQNKMMTKNVHSEILFCLSPTKNVGIL